MNRELAQLMAEAGIGDKIEWRNVVMVYNYAPIPAPPLKVDISGWHRGFNLVVLANGRPEHFVKCRPAGEEVLERETIIRSALAGARPGALSVAPVRGAKSRRMDIQVSPFLRGSHYGHIVPRQSTEEFIRTLRTVLLGAADLARLALRECALVRTSTTTVRVSEVIESNLEFVAELATLDADQRAALAAVVSDAGEVPSIPQHGDFWWQNVIFADDHLWAIDFDSYGDVRVPLYDDLTMIVTTLGARAGAPPEVIDRLTSPDPAARACRLLLAERAAAEGLTESQMDGVLVYYLVHLTSIVHRRGGFTFSTPYIAAVRHAAQYYASGKRSLLAVTP